MTTSSYLGGQSGVQYNGIETDTGGYPKFNLQNVLLVGEFKRGPFHKPFKVTKETMEAQLSYDYNNPYYIALEDAFKIGAEYVWVMRVDATVYVWGEWQVNASIAIQNNKVRYTAYKTNGKVTFDGFAELDLVAVITASLSDPDMQQWQAVKDASNDLTGGLNWVWDELKEKIVYKEYDTNNSEYLYYIDGLGWSETSVDLVCERWWGGSAGGWGDKEPVIVEGNLCKGKFSKESNYQTRVVKSKPNPNYDQNYYVEKYVSFSTIAQKIISNASSSDQGISLLAETYIEQVAENVSLDNLIPQFETNKTQR